MYCIDNDQVLQIFGQSDETDYLRLEIEFLACDPSKNPNCTNTLDETKAYLDTPNFVWLVNRPRFDPTNFENPSAQESVIYN